MVKQYFLFISIFVIIYASVDAQKKSATTVAATTTEPVPIEGEDNNVVVHFMDLKKSEFIETLPKIEKSFATVFNDYCKDNDQCSSIEADEYKLRVVGETEKEKYVEDNRYIITKLVMTYLNEQNETQYVPKSLLTDFITKSRDKLVKESKVDIAYINNKFIYPMRNNLDNYIIIPISIAFVLVLVIFNFVCQKKSEKKQTQEFLNLMKPKEHELKKLMPVDKPEIIELSPKKSVVVIEEPTVRITTMKTSESFPSNEKTADKRKKARKSTAEAVAGKVTEGIGSNLAESNKWMSENFNTNNANITGSTNSIGRNKSNKQDFGDDFGFNGQIKYQPRYVSGEITSNNKRKATAGGASNTPSHITYNYEYPDPRVALRLASYERLPSTYDNVKPTNDFKPKTNSGSTRNVDL